MKNYFLFDMDGVLVDTEHLHEGALQLAASEFGYHVDPSGAMTSLAKLRRANIPEELHQAIYARKRDMFDSFVEQIKPDPALVFLFSKLRDNYVSICVCSNCNTKSCNKVLLKLGVLSYVDLLITSSDVKNGKPHPDIYKLALKRLRAEPWNVVCFEDSDEGIAAAVGAGISNVIRCTTTTLNKEVSKWL